MVPRATYAVHHSSALIVSRKRVRFELQQGQQGFQSTTHGSTVEWRAPDTKQQRSEISVMGGHASVPPAHVANVDVGSKLLHEGPDGLGVTVVLSGVMRSVRLPNRTCTLH